MATGDQNDIQSRLRQLIPHGWFLNGLSPLRDALLLGLANILAFGYSLLSYVRLQTRISTATDGFLDMIAGDFFGTGLARAANQTDTSYRSRILINIFRERVTRHSVVSILTQLTGRAPGIFEPARPADTGAYGAAVAVSRAATGTYYDAGGVLRIAAPNTPRYTYDPANLAAPSTLLIEAAATNLALNSAAFESGTWGIANASISPNVVTAPDGTTTADKLVENTAATVPHDVSQNVSCTAGVPMTLSVYAKAAERTTVRLALPTAAFGGTTTFALFNLSTGTVGLTGNSPVTTITPIGASGWYRCSITATPTVTTTGPLALHVILGTSTNYTGDGVSGLYLWGAQVEAGAAATSYIPSGGTATTRDADVLLTNMPAGSGALGGYGVAGGYGSMLLPMQAFVTAYRPFGSGVPYVAGYGISTGAYSTPSQSDYVGLSQVSGFLTDADIFAAIDSVRPASYVIWARISS